MLITIILLFILLITIIAMKGRPMCWDDEEIVTETTIVTEDRPNVVGNLKRQVDGIQGYVIDPVDNQKIWVNSNDDMYEDADGKVWRLV